MVKTVAIILIEVFPKTTPNTKYSCRKISQLHEVLNLNHRFHIGRLILQLHKIST